MAAIESTLQTLLGALVSGRCYPVINNSLTVVAPYITFQMVSGDTWIQNQDERRYQIDVYATTYSGARVIAESIKTAMKSASFANAIITFQDLYEEVSKEFRVLLEFYIWPNIGT